MGNKTSAPYPNYETTCVNSNSSEILSIKNHFTSKFKIGNENPSVSAFSNSFSNRCSAYTQKYFVPRLFLIMDTKRDGVIDFEEYFPIVSFLRIATIEEKAKLLFLMYEPVKASYLTRESIQQIILDSIVLSQTELTQQQSLRVMEEWIGDQRDIASGLVDLALNQYASQEGRMDFYEFLIYFKTDGSFQALMNTLQSWLEPS